MGKKCLWAVMAIALALVAGCSQDAGTNPQAPPGEQPQVHFRLGPFYGFDSLHHYEYSKTIYDKTHRPPNPNPQPDSVRCVRMVTELGYGVFVSVAGPDTVRLDIGTRRLVECVDMRSPTWETDTAYDTLYASYAYLREGTGFRLLGAEIPPIPFLDRTYVTETDVGSELQIDYLSAAMRGEVAEYTHFFYDAYGPSGTGKYRQGIGMTYYYAGSEMSNVTIMLLDAKP